MNIVNDIQSAIQYYKSGDLQQSKFFCEKILELQPHNAEVLYFLGIIEAQLKNYDLSIKYIQSSLAINPLNDEAYLALGASLQHKGSIDDAIACYQKSVDMNPENFEAFDALGNAFRQKGQLDKAIACYQKALLINPANATLYDNIGNAFQIKGNPAEAEKYYRYSVEIDLGNYVSYQKLLFMMLYNSRYDAKTIFSEHLQFAKRFEEPLISSISPHANNRTSHRKIKIGYVSPDFKKHSVAYFIEPVLAVHNRENFEVSCYSLVPTEDEVTNRLKGYVDHWRNLSGISDEKAAELIRNDSIDILIDLSGHTTNNRILLFARKPAPVQVSWIGYLATTGLSSIDYRISDIYTDPPGLTEQFYTEKLIRLPESLWCYMPDKDSPDVGQLPALRAGYITFGSFNNFIKVSPETVSAWATILQAVPGSRLILKTFTLFDATTRQNIVDMFAHRGISAERIVLLPWETTPKHLESYNLVDIGLDTFPFNGGVTTCEAMWMGVPVITLAGTAYHSRVGASILSNIGLPELVAGTYDEYIKIAVQQAGDIEYLRALRERMRKMMAHSPLTDSKRFIDNLENAYRQIWQKWCMSV
jgi:protein O-GlcNAc transferase